MENNDKMYSITQKTKMFRDNSLSGNYFAAYYVASHSFYDE